MTPSEEQACLQQMVKEGRAFAKLKEERDNLRRHASVLHGLLAQNLTYAPSPKRFALCREAIKAFLKDFPS